MDLAPEVLCTYTENGGQCDNRWTLNFGRKLCGYHNAVLEGRAAPGPAPRKIQYVNWWMVRRLLDGQGEDKARKTFGDRIVNYLQQHPLRGSGEPDHLTIAKYGLPGVVPLSETAAALNQALPWYADK